MPTSPQRVVVTVVIIIATSIMFASAEPLLGGCTMESSCVAPATPRPHEYTCCMQMCSGACVPIRERTRTAAHAREHTRIRRDRARTHLLSRVQCCAWRPNTRSLIVLILLPVGFVDVDDTWWGTDQGSAATQVLQGVWRAVPDTNRVHRPWRRLQERRNSFGTRECWHEGVLA